jgi:hypothetical protein
VFSVQINTGTTRDALTGTHSAGGETDKEMVFSGSNAC